MNRQAQRERHGRIPRTGRAKRFAARGFLLVLSLACLPAGADILHLRDGETQAGVITVDRPELPTISIRTSGGELAVPRDRIVRVQSEPKSLGFMHIGDQFLERRSYAEAVTAYRAALDEDNANKEIQAKLAKAEGFLQEQKNAQVQEAMAGFDTQVSKARSLAKEKRFPDAIQQLRVADPGEASPKAADYRKAFAELYFLWGMDRADHQDLAGAAERLQQALKYDPGNENIQQQLARVWGSDPTKLQEVVSLYQNSTNPEDRLRLAEAYFKLRDYEKALPIYLEYTSDPKLASDVMRERIRFMYDAIQRRYASEGNFEKALEVYRAFVDFSPGEDLTPVAKYEYMIRRAQTDQNNPEQRAALAAYAEQQGLIETARQEYANILQIDPKNQVAMEGQRRFATAAIQDVRDFFSEGQFLLAYERANQVVQNYPMFPEITSEAQQWQARAEVEQQKAQRSRQQQAVALAQRGDDYFAQAQSYISAYLSLSVNPVTKVFSPKIEASKYLERALYAWQQALNIDPTLGSPTSYDLHRKIADAYARYVTIANPLPPRMPQRNNNQPLPLATPPPFRIF